MAHAFMTSFGSPFNVHFSLLYLSAATVSSSRQQGPKRTFGPQTTFTGSQRSPLILDLAKIFCHPAKFDMLGPSIISLALLSASNANLCLVWNMATLYVPSLIQKAFLLIRNFGKPIH